MHRYNQLSKLFSCRKITQALILILGLLPTSALFAQTKIPNTTQMLMKQKLAATHGLLDGIISQDLESLKKHADLLKSISRVSTWHKSDSEMFMSYARSFQNAADFLVTSAQEKNQEGVALGYVRVTLECMQCHNFVRDGKTKK